MRRNNGSVGKTMMKDVVRDVVGNVVMLNTKDVSDGSNGEMNVRGWVYLSLSVDGHVNLKLNVGTIPRDLDVTQGRGSRLSRRCSNEPSIILVQFLFFLYLAMILRFLDTKFKYSF